MEQIMEYVRPELLILLPVLYCVGSALKSSERFKDKHIPLVLGVAGVLAALLWVLPNTELTGFMDVLSAVFVSVTQGILCAGGSVYVNQLVKQGNKFE